jgi:Xaa-Pro aminopeptidase
MSTMTPDALTSTTPSAISVTPYPDALLRASALRRDVIVQELRQLGAGQGGIAVIPTAPEVVRNRDAHYAFRHDSSFHYLTGFDEPEAVLVLVVTPSHTQSVLFCRPKDLEREIWDGYRLGPDAAPSALGLDAAFPIGSIDEEMPRLLANLAWLAWPVGQRQAFDTQVQGWLDKVRAQSRAGVTAPAAFRDVGALIEEARLFKDSCEIDTMRRAARISSAAHARAMAATAPGMHEYMIEAELLHAFRRQGAQAPAYTSIVAGGANACTLHYSANDALLRDGALLLVDAGCELDGYASDITRTWPVNGRFSDAQRSLYELVLASQDAAIAVSRPGQSVMAGHDAALRVLTQGMLDLGLLQGSLDGALESGSYKQFYMHKTGHWLGRDVHDVGDYREPGSVAPEGGERPWRILRPGMVTTVEPGIYVRPAEGVPEQFHNIGIRIEDDVLITSDGNEVLSADAPKGIADIEALVGTSLAARQARA